MNLLKKFRRFQKIYISKNQITGLSLGISARYLLENTESDTDIALTGGSARALCSLIEDLTLSGDSYTVRKTTRSVEVTSGGGKWKFPLLRRIEREIPDLNVDTTNAVRVNGNELVKTWMAVILSGLFVDDGITHHVRDGQFHLKTGNQTARFIGAVDTCEGTDGPVITVPTEYIRTLIPIIADSPTVEVTPDGIVTEKAVIKTHTHYCHLGLEWGTEKGQGLDVPPSVFSAARVISDRITIENGRAVSVTDTAEMEIDIDTINTVGLGDISANPLTVVRALVSIGKFWGDAVFEVTPGTLVVRDKESKINFLIPLIITNT